MNILIINGPNINFLGIREKDIYGKKTYTNLLKYIKNYGKEKKIKIKIYQSNYEGKIIDIIQKAYFKKYDGIIINPGAYTHYSYAIYDALKSIDIPCVEVHLSDIYSRENFRKVSVIKEACIDTVHGLKFDSYIKGIEKLFTNLEGSK